MNYRDYISSQKWRRSPARLAELADARDRCRACFEHGTERQPIEVHHATYERLGNEAQGDLLALCRACHLAVTSSIRARRYSTHIAMRADVPLMRDVRNPLGTTEQEKW